MGAPGEPGSLCILVGGEGARRRAVLSRDSHIVTAIHVIWGLGVLVEFCTADSFGPTVRNPPSAGVSLRDAVVVATAGTILPQGVKIGHALSTEQRRFNAVPSGRS